MANSKQHFAYGAFTGAALNLFKQRLQMKLNPARRFDWGELALYSVGGGLVGVMADVLEPATTPKHRDFFHSVTFGSTVLYAAHGEHSERWHPEARVAARTASWCYVSHLAADAGTPAGIGLI